MLGRCIDVFVEENSQGWRPPFDGFSGRCLVSISMDSGMSLNLKEYHLQCSKLRYQFLGNFTFEFYLRTYLNMYIYIHAYMHAYRQTDRRTDGQTDRHACMPAYKQVNSTKKALRMVTIVYNKYRFQTCIPSLFELSVMWVYEAWLQCWA